MKLKGLLFFLFIIGHTYSQSDIYFYKDSSSSLTYKNIDKVKFTPINTEVLEKHSDATFWFKIPAKETYLSYILRIVSIRVDTVKAYQNLKEIQRLEYQRYPSFQFSRKYSTYIKVKSNFSFNFPVELNTVAKAEFIEKKQLLVNGIYYGITFLVILFSINYFYFFRDNSFLYHAFLLFSLTLSFVLSDGMFQFFNVNDKKIEILILFNYILLAYSSSKFTINFLLLDTYFPKVKRYIYSMVIGVILLAVLFLIFKKNIVYTILTVLTGVLLFIHWFISVLLFKKNTHTKLFALSYVILLFSGIDFFVLKKFGISLFETNAINIKIGGFIQVITLSFAVLFREKDLRRYNRYMKNEIIKYSKEIKKIITQEQKEPVKENLENLSLREREIFDLIVSGKSNKEIANEVNISVNTVKFHVKNIYGKLKIKSRKEALKI
ncbi:LuxR C-terminal-related transcriptional regulator [Polaribacter sp. L3A8]|uniref:LuxR C-terminal-related transcriptional regulator n=1 Tax=Polaribacter sp. L3A8 TaxID=2686361 RepID=UPI00131D2C08|nr:LuxR C-terminal-related transcriptional regulator [Polaribacter sp. L3A8]